jgi:predicted ribosome quality control (RQC) complex YloA/Tae2 family protein
MKQLSSIEIHFILKDIGNLCGSKVDRVFNYGQDFYFQLHKANVGRIILKVVSGKAVFIAEKKSHSEASHFCLMLRKHLQGKFLESVDHLKPERILKLVFRSKSEERILYLEMFAKGNIILCDKDVIIDALTKAKFRDRSILAKKQYKFPSMKYNIFSLGKEIEDLFKHSSKDKIVTSLAVEIGLGGVVAEEVCLLSKIDKNQDPKGINASVILASVKKIISSKADPAIVYKDKEAVDVVPSRLLVYKDYETKNFPSFSGALDYYFANEIKLIKKATTQEKKIVEIKRIIDEQNSTIKDLEKKESENRAKAELIYGNYQQIKNILDEINEVSQKHSWQEIKKKLKGHKVVRDLDVKEKRITVEI